MGVYGLLKNYSRGHDFNDEWKNRTPSAEYIKKIGGALGWDLETDLIVFEHDYGWYSFECTKWVSYEIGSKPEPSEYVIDTVFEKERSERNGWLTLDSFILNELCENSKLHTDPIANIRQCLFQWSKIHF